MSLAGTGLQRALELASTREYAVQDGLQFKTVIAPLDTFKAYLFELRQAGFKMLTSVMGIDYLEYTEFMPERFAVVYQLLNLTNAERIIVKVYVPDGENCPAPPTCGAPPTGTNAKFTTCSASSLKATQTCAKF
jgi:NADH:ubiquinone oxidoreductase subunit C